MPTTLTLHIDALWLSPYVFTCFVTLKEKGLDFSIVPIALQDKAQHDPSYRDRSITGRVPALKHGHFWLAESQAIVEYLDDAFPTTMRAFPEPIRERARARQIMGWLRSDLMPLREERPSTTMFYEAATNPLSEEGRVAAAKLLHVADLVIPDGKTTLFGAWSQADADLAFMLHRLILNGHEVPEKVRAFAEAQWARPSVRAFVEQDRDPYVAY